MSPYVLFPPFVRYFENVISTTLGMTDHIIVKYSICAHTWGDRSCTIFKKNIDIYVAKGGNLCGFIFSLIDDYCEKNEN